MKNWRSRLAANQMLKNLAIFNIFLLNQETKDEIKSIVLDLLCDEQLEVRLSAFVSLTSLIHSDLIQVDDVLLVNKTNS